MSSPDVKQREEWNAELRREASAGSYPRWPNEAMVKVLFGTYLEQPRRPQASWRVLEVGCLMGSNLLPFSALGSECHGVDIHPEMVSMAQRAMDARGGNIAFQVGSNRELPYPSGTFDLLLSLNTLHYEDSEGRISEALREFRRVLRPSGTLFLSTVAPRHDIYRRAELLGGHRYRIRDYGFRDGQEFFFMDTERYLQHFCTDAFEHVETGRVTEELMTVSLDFFIAVCHGGDAGDAHSAGSSRLLR